MYQKYNDVAFFVVYIGEAHPSDAWQVPSNIQDRVVYTSPTSSGERANLADICVTRVGIKLPALVDRFDVLMATGVAWLVVYARSDVDSKAGQVVGHIVSDWTQVLGLVLITKYTKERGSKEDTDRGQAVSDGEHPAISAPA
jgi:hypothetical protein